MKKIIQIIGNIKQKNCDYVIDDLLSGNYKEIEFIISNKNHNLKKALHNINTAVDNDCLHTYSKNFHFDSQTNIYELLDEIKKWSKNNSKNKLKAFIILDPSVSRNDVKEINKLLHEHKLILLNINYFL